MLSWDNPDDIIIVNFSDMEKNSSRATQDIKWLFSQAEKKSINRATVNSFSAQEYNVTFNSIGVITFMKNGDYNL